MIHNVLIDLDVLFDTRLGAIVDKYPDLVDTLLEKGWTKRNVDDPSLFTDKISKVEFDELYKNRNKSALQNSVLTNFIIEMGDVIGELRDIIAYDVGQIKESTILLNLYPYTDLSSIMHVPIDSGYGNLMSFRWIFAEDSAFNDYMAALSNLSTAEMYYRMDKLKLNFARWRAVTDGKFTPAALAMDISDSAVGRLIRGVSLNQSALIQN